VCEYNVVAGAAKTLRRLLGGNSDAGIRFDDWCRLLESLVFENGVRGSLIFFARPASRTGSFSSEKATTRKPCHVKQVRAVILKYGLGDIE